MTVKSCCTNILGIVRTAGEQKEITFVQVSHWTGWIKRNISSHHQIQYRYFLSRSTKKAEMFRQFAGLHCPTLVFN